MSKMDLYPPPPGSTPARVCKQSYEYPDNKKVPQRIKTATIRDQKCESGWDRELFFGWGKNSFDFLRKYSVETCMFGKKSLQLAVLV